MAGAAAESIRLALAVATVADEAKVLLEYNTTGGRRRVTERVGANPTLASRLEMVLRALGHWQDDAGRGAP
jgi:hypothetical protein